MGNRRSEHATKGIDPVIAQAIDWMVCTGSGEMDAAQKQQFENWLAEDERHRLAWEDVSSFLQQPVTTILQADLATPGHRQAARIALSSQPASAKRRKVIGGGVAVLLLGLSAYIANREYPVSHLRADFRTGTGKRRTETLADGSRLMLNARSAVDVKITHHQRLIHLIDGDIMISVAHDAARPFVVLTRDGTVQALGTKFAVSLKEQHSLVAVVEHSVTVSNTATLPVVLEKGAVARFDRHDVTRLEPSYGTALTSWTDGILEVRNQPLIEVINALRPYLSAHIHLSPKAATLRISGVFSLDDPESTLIALVETQPIVLRKWGSMLIWIDIHVVT